MIDSIIINGVEYAPVKTQKPIAFLNDAHLARGVVEGETSADEAGPGMVPVYRFPLVDAIKPATMSKHEASLLKNQMEKSSFDYAMVSYSTYTFGSNIILDQRFHQLRDQFLSAREQLEYYLHENGALP